MDEGVVGLGDLLQKLAQGLALDEAGRAERDRRQQLQQLLRGPGLEFKQALDLLVSPVRSTGVLYGASGLGDGHSGYR
jgi:hypothetical protein